MVLNVKKSSTRAQNHRFATKCDQKEVSDKQAFQSLRGASIFFKELSVA